MLVNVPTGTLVAALTQAATVLPVATYCDDIAPGNQAVVDVTYGNVTEQITIGQCVNGYPSIIARGTQPRAFPAGSCVTNVIPEAETECPDPIEYTWSMEDGDVNTKYSRCYELPLDEYTLGDTLIPDGFEIDITGKSLCIWSTALPERLALHPVRAEIWKDNCLFAIVSGALDIVDNCYVTPPCPVVPGCSYSWAMTPTTVAVGQPVKTSFIAPEDCPENVTLSLDVFEADGTTPYLVGGQPLVISVDQGTSEYRPIASEAGTVIVFKPSTVQQQCLLTCQASIPSQKRVVLTLAPCTVSWDFEPKTFTAGVSTPITYSATGPAGGRVKLIVYNGNTEVVGIPALYLPFGVPLTFSNLWRVEDIGQDWNWRVAPTGQDADVAGCTIQPGRIDLDVTSSNCVIAWSIDPSPVTVGQASSIKITSGPPNCAIAFEAYTVPGDELFVGSRVTIATNASGIGATIPAICDAPGSAKWKPVDPQPNSCARLCTFGVQSITHTCTGDPGTGTASCGLVLALYCQPGSSSKIDGLITGLVIATSYSVDVFKNGAWVNNYQIFTATDPSHFFPLDELTSAVTYFRVVNAARTCSSNEIPHPCAGTATPKYYCSSGTCAQALTPPAASSGPFDTLVQCQAVCGSGVSCVNILRSVGTFYAGAPCGTTIPLAAIAGNAWTTTFSIGAGATVSATGMPAGMTANTFGTDFVLTWATPTVGVYAITVTGIKAGCPNCSYPVQLNVAAAGGTVCASLVGQVLQGPSAYTPTPTAWNAADQLLQMTVSGTPGQTYQLRTVGTITSLSAILTIPPSGQLVTTTTVGQAYSYSTTWSIEAAGGNPISVCAGAGSVLITGHTAMEFAVLHTANTYSVIVIAPIGANGVPFVLRFGGPYFAGSSAICADNNFGVPVTGLTTNSSGGGNVFTYVSDPLPHPYAAAIKFELSPGTSALTHQLPGITCQEFVIP